MLASVLRVAVLALRRVPRIEVRVTRGNVFDLVVATRRRGELSYRIAPLATASGARIASPDQPLEIALAAGGENRRPWLRAVVRDRG